MGVDHQRLVLDNLSAPADRLPGTVTGLRAPLACLSGALQDRLGAMGAAESAWQCAATT